jgi:hypothetical protein
MRKYLPYLLGLIVFILFAALIIAGNKNPERKLDERITLRQRDKIPYGMSVAKTLVPKIFPDASVFSDNNSPGNWDSLSATSYNQAVVLVSKDFNADEYELSRLLQFAQQGNYIFIIAKSFSYDAEKFFKFSYNRYGFDGFVNPADDSLAVKLEMPFFASDQTFRYPGKRYESSFYSLDTAHCTVMGRNGDGQPDFVRFVAGNGAIFVHIAPLAFSNYFILHKSNYKYFQNALSVIPAKVEKVLWNEYYLSKPASTSRKVKPSWFRVLLSYPAFRWGLFTGILVLLLAVLSGMRRRQRMIPPYSKPTNDSLDFVKTMGRLYHDRRDHLNLARKMSVYFLENIRNRYKLPTHVLDEEFTRALHYKTGYPLEELTEIISVINALEKEPSVTEKQLSDFHQKLELFYQNT